MVAGILTEESVEKRANMFIKFIETAKVVHVINLDITVGWNSPGRKLLRIFPPLSRYEVYLCLKPQEFAVMLPFL